MQIFSDVGYLDDEAIETLRSIFDTMLGERGIPDQSPGAEELATRIVNLYLAGTTNAVEIREQLDRPRAA